MLPGLDAADTGPGRTQSLYRKYRPTTFQDDELVGQEHVTRTLRNAIARDRVAHAYLFCGPRGTGKTSTARLLAKAVNCQHPDPEARPCNECPACQAINASATTDIVEVDAASNRGIEDIREIREQVNYAPTQLRRKVYIIDEAHQITGPAFNAFLKTLEEPPPHVTFVLATTDPDKLPDTITSRCQRFDFRRIPFDDALRHLTRISEREGFDADEEALAIIVRRATGSLRDAESLLDMLATAAGAEADGRISVDLARRMLGLSDDGYEYDLVGMLAERDIPGGLRVIAQVVDVGHDMRAFTRRVVDLLRVLMLLRAGAEPVEANERNRALAERFSLPDLLHINRQFSDVDHRLRDAGVSQLPLELAFLGSLLTGAQDAAAATVPPTISRQPTAPAAAPAPAYSPPARERAPEPQRERPSAAPAASSSGSFSPAPPPRPPRPPAEMPGSAPARAAHGDDAPDNITPIRGARPAARRADDEAPASTPAAGGSGGGGSSSASIADVQRLWERIRTEVRVVDRKIDALLASTDPHAVIGDDLYIVAAYAFHVSKLAEARVTGVVEDAVATVVGRRFKVHVVLRDQVPRQSGSGGGGAAASPPVSAPATSAPATPPIESSPAEPPRVVQEATPPAAPSRTTSAPTEDGLWHSADPYADDFDGIDVPLPDDEPGRGAGRSLREGGPGGRERGGQSAAVRRPSEIDPAVDHALKRIKATLGAEDMDPNDELLRLFDAPAPE